MGADSVQMKTKRGDQSWLCVCVCVCVLPAPVINRRALPALLRLPLCLPFRPYAGTGWLVQGAFFSALAPSNINLAGLPTSTLVWTSSRSSRVL